MKRVSAASSKGRGRLKERPDPDSIDGGWYDTFRENPATPIKINFGKSGSSSAKSRLERLRDYGLDIRKHSLGRYWLVGEYTDRGYVDYIAERLKAKPHPQTSAQP